MNVVEARELAKVYGTGEAAVHSLQGIDLTIARGELVAIMGPSGSGKSTLLCILGGIEPPSSGSVYLEGTELSKLTDDQRTLLRRRRIGFVFQSFNLLPTLTALENVSLPLELDGMPSPAARRRAFEMLELVEVVHRQDHVPGKMSGGEQQRVAVARALAIQPALLLADEPTGNLDSANSQRITQLLRQLVTQRGQTMILVTHDPSVAAMSDRIICLRDGRIVDSQEGMEPAGSSAIAREGR